MIARGMITTKNQGVLIAIIISVPTTVIRHQMNERLFTGIIVSIVSMSLENLQYINSTANSNSQILCVEVI